MASSLSRRPSGWLPSALPRNLAALSGVPAGIAGVAGIGDSGCGPMFNDWSNADSGGKQCPGDAPNFGVYRVKYAMDPPWWSPLPCRVQHPTGSNFIR